MADMIPYMRMYPADYRRDTGGLSTLEHGAYFLLILAYWENRGPLPDDDERLARRAGVSLRVWQKMRAQVEVFFHISGGVWSHKRIDAELAFVTQKSQKSAKAGRASAAARANGRSTGVAAKSQLAGNHDKTSDKRGSFPADAEKEHSLAGEPDLPLAGAGEAGADAGEDEATGKGETYTRHFEAFWKSYPKKTGKGDAARRYEAAIKRMGGGAAAHDRMLRSVNAWVQVNRKTEARFIPNPSTWLNQSRYDDDAVVDRLQQASAAPSQADRPPRGSLEHEFDPNRIAKPRPGYVPGERG